MDADAFNAWQWRRAIADADILTATGATRRTLKRWKSDGISTATENAIRFQIGDLRQWPGWSINARAELCDPHTGIHTRGSILATFYHLQQIQTLRAENRRLHAALDRQNFLATAANDSAGII